MADDKTYRSKPGGALRIRLSKRPGGPQGQQGQGDEEQGGGRGQTPDLATPARLAKDIYIPDDDALLHFYDLGAKFLPGTPASYIELKGLLPVALGTYEDADWATYVTQLLDGAFGTTPLTGSSGRAVSNRLPFNKPSNASGPVQYNPGLIIRTPTRDDAANDSEMVWKQVTVTGEDWSPVVTTPKLAPDYGYWAMKDEERWGHVEVSDSRWMNFKTWDTAAFKVTLLPDYAEDVAEFKLKWPLKVYAVPRLFYASEFMSSAINESISFKRVTKRVSVFVGSGSDSFGPYTDTKVTTYELTPFWLITEPISSNNYYMETSRYPLARSPLIPVPWVPQVQLSLSAESWVLGLPEEAREYVRHIRVQFRRTERWVIARTWATKSSILSSSPTTTTTHQLDESTVHPGRPRDWNTIRSDFTARIAAQVTALIGAGPYVEYNLPLYNDPPLPFFTAPKFDFFVTQLREGQLCAVLKSGSQTYYVWRKT